MGSLLLANIVKSTGCSQMVSSEKVVLSERIIQLFCSEIPYNLQDNKDFSDFVPPVLKV